jgi:hypothetical protein
MKTTTTGRWALDETHTLVVETIQLDPSGTLLTLCGTGAALLDAPRRPTTVWWGSASSPEAAEAHGRQSFLLL